MKKLLAIGLLTVCVLAISEQSAQAWVNSKFGIGLNWHNQSGNTSFLWGLWRNGQVPGPEGFGPGPGQGAPNNGGGPFNFLGAQNGMPQAAPAPAGAFLQGMPQGYPQPVPVGYPQPMPQMFQPAPMAQPVQNVAQQQFYNPYRTASYQPQSYNYSPPVYYYYPVTNEDSSFFWYGPR